VSPARRCGVSCAAARFDGSLGVLSTSNIPELTMNLHVTIGPIVALIAGILILLMPQLLNYIVAIYLIIIGVMGLIGSGSLRQKLP
jgi:threonine/homoserine efflux transporter RhtA